MKSFITDLLSVLEEPGGGTTVAILSLLLPFPILNFFPLGYIGALTRKSLEYGEFFLPEMEFLVGGFGLGGKIFLLLALVFAPSWFLFLSAVFSFILLTRGGGVGLFGHSLLVIFFVLLGAVVFILSLFVLPIALLRFAESGEIAWAVDLKGILRDLDDLGGDYWQNWISLFLLLCAVEFLLLAISIFFSFFPFGWVGGFLFFGFGSSFSFVYLALVGVRRSVATYRELHYHY